MIAQLKRLMGRREHHPPVSTGAVDIVFVIAEANRGWVLDGISRDTGRHIGGTVAYHYGVEELPAAKAYFFSHYSLYIQALHDGRLPSNAKTLVYYTHPRDIGVSNRRLVSSLSRCTRVISMASMHSRELVAMGLPESRVTTVLGAADPDTFRPHERGSGVVGMVSAYYPRKSPERLVSLVRAMPDTPFLLVGRGWRESASSDDLVGLHNLEIVEAPYSDYPSYYTKMDVFVSVSSLEGGPIPLIEAMMSNVVPIATRTGFAPDIVTNGINGFLCDVDVSTTALVGLVREGLRFRGEIHPTVRHLNWERYARFVSRELDQGEAT